MSLRVQIRGRRHVTKIKKAPCPFNSPTELLINKHNTHHESRPLIGGGCSGQLMTQPWEKIINGAQHLLPVVQLPDARLSARAPSSTSLMCLLIASEVPLPVEKL